jgi:hypothetical protein
MTGWSDDVTGVAALLGVLLAGWKWVGEKQVMIYRQIMTLDGDVTLELVDSNDRAVGVFINSMWNNRGLTPIYLSPKKTRFSIFEIATAHVPVAVPQAERSAAEAVARELAAAGPEANPARLVLEFYPIADANWFMLEPKTKSRIQATVLLERDKMYELHCYLEGDKDREINWFRKRLFSTSMDKGGANARRGDDG